MGQNKTNLDYFEISATKPEIPDTRYMCLEWDKDINEYVSTTKKLKELLATIKTLNERGDDAEKIYEDLFKLVKNKFSSKSELNCFINACDATTATVTQDNTGTFRELVDLYLKHRDFTELTPKEWIQAIIDKGASRKKGKIGEMKVVELAKKAGFNEVDNWNDFKGENKVVTRFSKGVFDAGGIKNNLGLDLDFKSQDKMLDIILKNGNKIAFLEAKHLKEGGGEQDKQIKELIDIVSKCPQKDNVYHIAFMDGLYSNILLTQKSSTKKNKIEKQLADIKEALRKNENCFWVNTKGLTALLQNF